LGHENGSVESSNRYRKDQIDQALELRSHRDFADTRGWTCVSAFARSSQAGRVVTPPAPNEQDARDNELVCMPMDATIVDMSLGLIL
jgi:hypothetical protein